MVDKAQGLSVQDRFAKRTFDIIFSVLGLILGWWIILIAYLIASVDTGASGFFRQIRVGKDGQLFRIVKIRTMRSSALSNTSVTTDQDPRITKIGRFFRKAKIDELPQLVNVLVGNMSFVGPRPDVPGFADQLKGNDRIILSVRPGITGPATLEFRAEEALLAKKSDPELYNREVIFPEKIELNKEYVKNYSFLKDLKYIYLTIVGS